MGLEEFRKLHPWAEPHLRLGRPREYLWTFDLPGEPAALWPFVADTARTNRAAGLAEMHYQEKDGVLHGWHRTGGVRHQFVERWQWVAPHSGEVIREYSTGFVRVMRSVLHLERRGGGSRLYAYYGWVVRGALGALALRVGMAVFESRFRGIVARLGAAGATPTMAAVLRLPPPDLDSERLRRVSAIRGELRERGVDAGVLDQLVDLAVAGDEIDVDRIRVRKLASDWNVEERAVVVAALEATRAGLLELTWDVMCPHCRGVREKLNTLGDVAPQSRCDVCALDFGTDAENAIEVTFRVHPSIRPRVDAVYCSAEPVRRTHVRLQQDLAAGEVRAVPTALELGRYRLRRRGDDAVHTLEVAGTGAGGETVAWGAGGAPARAEVGPEPVLEISAGAAPATFVVEEANWDRFALQPGQLFPMSEFRDLFSHEHLAAGVKLYVGEQTILFSDIVGSTRFYVEAGDPAAFLEVKKHFALVYEAVSGAGGAVVKTIGDAVMAAFADPVAALKAAADIHRRFPGAVAGDPESPRVRLRVSINTGPCIAVNLNSGVDYFGGTVNTAAKLQQCAGAGEVAIRDTVMQAPGAAGAVRAIGGETRAMTLDHEALGRLAVVVWQP
jgi:class 3 adenylate cyclase